MIKTTALSSITRENRCLSPTRLVSQLTPHLMHKLTDPCELSMSETLKRNVIQVKLLFPEFFRIGWTDACFAQNKVGTIKLCVKSSLDQELDETLVRSWLRMYGGDSQD